MTGLLDTIPPLEGAVPDGTTSIRRATSSRFSRRTFVRGTAAMGVGLGLVMLGWLPPARRAYASHSGEFGYRIKPLPCPTAEGWDQTDTNCDGCAPSRVCSECCFRDPDHHKHGWHKGDFDSQGEFKLRPGDCTSSGDKDGWIWGFEGCCGCRSDLRWRCHDGYQRNAAGEFARTVCRWTQSSQVCPRCG
jgi:hypothetical protein